MAKHAIEMETIEFERSHGRTPRGRGSWAFSFMQRPDIDDILWTPSMTYSAACAYIKRFMQAAQTREDLAQTTKYMQDRNEAVVAKLPLHLRPGHGGAHISLFVQP